VYNDMHCVKNVAKTLHLQRELNVTVWRHKQRTRSNNDHHRLLVPPNREIPVTLV